jgi:hypothetical protein
MKEHGAYAFIPACKRVYDPNRSTGPRKRLASLSLK